jgi:hypothetical protein
MKLARFVPLILLSVTGCDSCKDEINFTSIAGTDLATVLVDGRRWGCTKYEVARGSAKAEFPNLWSRGKCRSEVGVFARSNAMGFKTDVNEWSYASGDKVDVPMQAPYVVPLNICILSGDFASHSVSARKIEAMTDVVRATQLYDNEQCGVVFSITALADETQAASPDLLNVQCDDNNVGAFKAIDHTITSVKGINVFYTEGPSGLQGNTCPEGNSAVITITQTSGSEILAHELGHALSLGHSDGPIGIPLKGIPPANLMMSNSGSSSTLTIGQCFRINANKASVLHKLGIRTEPGRVCPDSDGADDCPPLALNK